MILHGSILLRKRILALAFLQMILKNYSEDPQIMIFTTALITNVLIVFVLYKYSRMFELSILCLYYRWIIFSFNEWN